jgi:ATP-dependent RNA circularization protein (DNA/RNA ligase family)
MARKKLPKTTPEEHARHHELQRMVRERMAYHEQKAREEEERRARKSLGRRLLERLKLA